METLLQGATRLFAALGYDATTMAQIKEITGVDPAKAGTKRDLYIAVLERAHRLETEALDPGLQRLAQSGGLEDIPAALHEIVDRYIDFCVAHPEFPALWIHRWLYDAADLTGLEREYSQPLISLSTKLLQDGLVDQDVDMEYCVWTLIWCVHGFVQGGVLDPDGERIGAGSAQELARFRKHMHQLTHRALALPGPPVF